MSIRVYSIASYSIIAGISSSSSVIIIVIIFIELLLKWLQSLSLVALS